MSWICPTESCDDCPLFPCDVVQESFENFLKSEYGVDKDGLIVLT